MSFQEDRDDDVFRHQAAIEAGVNPVALVDLINNVERGRRQSRTG